jgi:hypothetical protein
MKKLLLFACLAVALMLVSGCKSHPGSREYAPGKGWQET